MCRWRSWILPGLIAVALLTAMAMVFKSGSIESDLTARATAGLAADGQGWATVTLDGRDATLQGTAPSPDAKILAMQSADRVYGVRVVDDGAAILPLQAPYAWSATRAADGSVTLSGFIPDEATRKAVNEAISKALPGVTIKDEQKRARGAPAGLTGAAAFAGEQLAKLAEGAVAYQDQALTATGRAASLESYADITSALTGGLPAGFSLAAATITPPVVSPYVWSATLTAGGIALDGLVPSQAVRADLVAAAKAITPSGTVTDTLKLASGAPDGFGGLATFALSQLQRFTTGAASLSDAALTLSGQAKSPADYAATLAALGQLPAGATLASNTVLPAVVSNWTFGIAKTQNVATVSGFVPSAAARTAILSAIGSRIPGVQVVDQTQLAASLPDGFAAAADFGVTQLARLETGAFGLSPAGATLEGVAADPAARDALVAGLTSALPAGVTLQSQRITARPPSPFGIVVARTGTTVSVTGYVPSEASRAAIKAAVPGATVTDTTRLADGAPAGFAPALTLGLAQFTHLADATISVSDAALSVRGVARTPEAYEAALAALATAPAGTTIALKDIAPAVVSDWRFGVERSADRLTLTGFIASDAERAALLATVAAAFPGVAIDDQLKLAAGQPAGFADTVRFGLTQLGRLEVGELAVTGTGLSLTGEAADPTVQDAIEAALKAGVPGGATVTAKLTARPPSPYVFAAAKIGNALSLNGYVPDQATRDALLEAIALRFGRIEVRDNVRVIAGAPAGFKDAAITAVAGASRLEGGTALLTDQAVSLTGGAFYDKALALIRTDLQGGLPQGWAGDVTGLTVLPPPPQVDRPTCQIRVDEVLSGNSIRFTTGGSEISSVSAGLLDQLVYAAARCTSNRIEISGHTDSDGTDEANQTLSEARTQAVSAYLVDAGITAERLIAVGRGETQPIAPNDTADNKAKNRRIELKVLDQN